MIKSKMQPAMFSSQYNSWNVQFMNTSIRAQSNHAVLILNRPLTQNDAFLTNLWNNASVRVTVDGGTNQWDLFVKKLPEKAQTILRVPDLITGDFDSIPETIFLKYKKKGCKMIHTPDQNHTDFTKALMELNKFCQERKVTVEHVFAIGQSSGRLDQIIGNIQTLFLVKTKNILKPKIKVYLLCDDSISWLLHPGQHVIAIPEETRNHKRAWCSLVPVGETCQNITTSGLKWNLTQQSLKFGELVSTSNTFDGSESVMIKCSHTVLWSMRIPMVSGQL